MQNLMILKINVYKDREFIAFTPWQIVQKTVEINQRWIHPGYFKEKIHEIINEKNPDLPNKEEVSRQVGIGAILFNDLYNQRIKDVIFNWDKILNFDGETGPYV